MMLNTSTVVEQYTKKWLRWAHLLYRRSAAVRRRSLDVSEVEQEVRIAVFTATRTYKPGTLSSFDTYCRNHIIWQLNNQIHELTRYTIGGSKSSIAKRYRKAPSKRIPFDFLNELSTIDKMDDEGYNELIVGSNLTVIQRCIIDLRFKHGMNHTQIAKELGMTVNRVDTHYSHALTALQIRHGLIKFKDPGGPLKDRVIAAFTQLGPMTFKELAKVLGGGQHVRAALARLPVQEKETVLHYSPESTNN